MTDEITQEENLAEDTSEQITQENEDTPKTNVSDDEKSDRDKQIASLNAQRQWEKRKRHEAEERFQQLQEEVDELKKDMNTSISPEKDLSETYSDWEFMDENTRNVLQKMQVLENRLQSFEIEKEKERAKEQWEIEFNKLTQDKKELENNKTQFKEFTGKEKYKNIPLPILSELFFSKLSKKKIPEPIGLEKNLAGERKTNTGLSFDDISVLRQTNPQEYMRLIKEKRLKMPKE
jgi:hypothetical protein